MVGIIVSINAIRCTDRPQKKKPETFAVIRFGCLRGVIV